MKTKNCILLPTCAALLCFALASCGSSNTVQENSVQAQTQPTIITTSASSEISETNEVLEFELVAGEQGDYGKMISYNKGTEFEENFYAYYIPYGTYEITNIGEYMTQVNVYSDKITVNDAGWEEIADAYGVELIDVNATKEMTIPQNYHIEIGEPCHIALKQISAEVVEVEPQQEETTFAIEEDEIYENTRQMIEDIIKEFYSNSKVTHQNGTKQFAVDIYPDGFNIDENTIKTDEDRETWENIKNQYCEICLLLQQKAESNGIENAEITIFVNSCDDPPKTALSIYNGAVLYDALS